MDRLRTRPTVPLDADLLHTLSLQIGTSLELQANCEAFLQALLAHLEVDFAAVWLQGSYLERGRRPDGYGLAYALPWKHVDAHHLAPDHPLVREWDASDFVSVAPSDPVYAAYCTEKDLADGTFTLLRLGELGFLKLYDADQAPFVRSALAPLRPVVDHFTASLEQCIAYRHAVEDLDERDRQQTRLRQTIERLTALVGQLHTGVLVESNDLEVTLVNQAFCDALGLTETPEAMIGLRRPHLIRRLKPRLADPESDLPRLGEIARTGRPVVGEVITMADGRVLHLDYTPLDVEDYRGHIWQYHAAAPQAHAASDGAAGGRVFIASDGPTGRVPPSDDATASFRPADFVHAVADSVREEASAKGIAVQTFISDGLAPTLVIAVEPLREVLHTLMHNAVRHTERGHVALAAVPVGRRQERVIVQFSVADTGPGIAPDVQDHLFDADQHVRLRRAHQRIDALGGDLSVQSVQGRGSVFTAVVPCRLPETELS